MFMRFLHLRVKEENFNDLKQAYENVIIPVLQSTKGCIFASLIKSTHRQDECISLTLWETKQDADEYTERGPFKELLKKVEPYLSDTSEWKIQLSTDYTLEYKPVTEDPVIKTHTVTHTKSDVRRNRDETNTMYVRIVSAIIKPGKMDEARSIYEREVIPALREVKGCKYVFLTENVQEKNEAFSVTIWDSQEDAIKYENSGLFSELLGKLQHTFSDLYQWKMNLEKESSDKVITSDDVAIEYFKIVAGKTFTE